MLNPWLEVPLAEYEGHMTSPAVQQMAALSDLFAEVLTMRSAESVAILGVAGGNGLDRIDTAQVRRIVGIDINSEYLAAVRERHNHLPNLELHCVNLSAETLSIAPVELVHAALVFEHAGVEQCFENAVSLVAPGGALSVILQLPTQGDANVGTSSYAAVQRFKDHFQLVPPEEFAARLKARGFSQIFEKRHPLVSGKSFWMSIFVREPAAK